MNDLVGKIFLLADGRYRIVDVQRLSGDALVYAEREDRNPLPASGERRGGRTAFHYDDIARYLEGGAAL